MRSAAASRTMEKLVHSRETPGMVLVSATFLIFSSAPAPVVHAASQPKRAAEKHSRRSSVFPGETLCSMCLRLRRTAQASSVEDTLPTAARAINFPPSMPGTLETREGLTSRYSY